MICFCYICVSHNNQGPAFQVWSGLCGVELLCLLLFIFFLLPSVYFHTMDKGFHSSDCEFRQSPGWAFLSFFSRPSPSCAVLICLLKSRCVISHGSKFWSTYDFKYYLYSDDYLFCTPSPNGSLDLRPFRLAKSFHSFTPVVSLKLSPSLNIFCFFFCWVGRDWMPTCQQWWEDKMR